MRSILRFLINLLLIIGVIWLLMKFTPVWDWVRSIWAKRTDISITTPGVSDKQPTNYCETPWGVKIPNGSTIFAYKDILPWEDGKCEEEVRSCKKWVLDGSYTSPSCLEKPTSWEQYMTLPDWTIVTSGGSNMWTGTVPNNQGNNQNVLAANWASCTTPRGQTIQHGNYIVSYQSPSSCTFQRRMCVDGTLMWNFMYNYCILPRYYTEATSTIAWVDGWTNMSDQALLADAEKSWDSSPYAVGSSRQYMQVTYWGVDSTQTPPSDKWNENTKGNVAVVSTSNTTSPTPTKTYAEPKDTSDTTRHDLTQKACTTPRWGLVAHGQYVIAYKVAVPADGTCQYERRACHYGVLDGSFKSPTCTIKGKTYDSSSWMPWNAGYYDGTSPSTAGKACRLPWGWYVADGSYIKAYRSSTSSRASGCQWEYRFCRNWVLDGSYTSSTCTLVKTYNPSSCSLPWWWTIAHGQSVLAYENWQSPCYGEWRTCNDGFLWWTYLHRTCTTYVPETPDTPDIPTTPDRPDRPDRPQEPDRPDRPYRPDPYIPQPIPQDVYGNWESAWRLDPAPTASDTCHSDASQEYMCAANAAFTCVDYKKVEDDCCIAGRAKYEKRTITCVK